MHLKSAQAKLHNAQDLVAVCSQRLDAMGICCPAFAALQNGIFCDTYANGEGHSVTSRDYIVADATCAQFGNSSVEYNVLAAWLEQRLVGQDELAVLVVFTDNRRFQDIKGWSHAKYV